MALEDLFKRLKAHRVWSWDSTYGVTPVANKPETDEPDLARADLISSELRTPVADDSFISDGVRHIVALDVDYPVYVRETSPGHHHIYLDVPGGIAHDDYMELLALLGKLGVVEEGYAGASIKRGYSSLRPPWVKKGRPILRCLVCEKRPDEIDEYIRLAEQEEITPDEFVWREEGTLLRVTGDFTCTACYIKLGQPLNEDLHGSNQAAVLSATKDLLIF